VQVSRLIEAHSRNNGRFNVGPHAAAAAAAAALVVATAVTGAALMTVPPFPAITLSRGVTSMRWARSWGSLPWAHTASRPRRRRPAVSYQKPITGVVIDIFNSMSNCLDCSRVTFGPV